MRKLEKLHQSRSPAVAVIDGKLVNIHSDKFIRQILFHVPSESHGVFKSFRAMVEGVQNGILQQSGCLFNQLFAQIFSDDVAAQWQWEPGFVKPPLAKIDNFL